MRANQKILVVDDDPVVGKSFNRVLSNKGYIVIHAQNAQEALTKLQGVDLVYTDIRMPGMNGLDFAEEMKARRPWTPVVIITGFGTEANEARAKAAGVTAFLQKPLSPEMIEGSALDALRQPEPPLMDAAVAKAEVVSAGTMQAAAEDKRSLLANIALLAAAPFIGLAFFALLPTVGLAALAVFGIRRLLKMQTAKKVLTFVKNVALFAAAPFIGLLYAMLLPLVGFGVVAGMGFKALMKYPAARKAFAVVKQAGLVVAAPFIGLAFIIALPFAGTAMLALTGTRALMTRLDLA
jgi:CheY-like chemotaxis protein